VQLALPRSRFEESAGSRCGVKALTLDALLKVLSKGIVEEAGFLAMLLKNRPEKKELLPIDFSGLCGYYLDNGSGG
jgi:hypothetical protein